MLTEARSPSNLVDPDLFRVILDLEIQKATRLQYCVALVALSVESEPGHDAAELHRRVARMAAPRFRSSDVVSVTDPPSVVALLVDAEAPTLPRILGRATEALRTALADAPGPPARVTWSAGGACYPRTASTGGDLMRQANALMARARSDGGDRLYLP